tara:strand:+ start:2356 stop:3210 length:855 start_codon:yes stop_codon:yes gene_type:complete
MSTVSIILLVLIIEYFYDDLKNYRKDVLIINSFDYLKTKINSERYSERAIYLFFIGLVLFMSLIIASILDTLVPVIYFIVSFIIILFSLRTNEYNRDIEELKIKLEFKKDNIDKSLLYRLCPNLKQARAKKDINNLVIKNLFFNSVRNTFAVLFFFILLGAPGALTYKVLDFVIYSDDFKINQKNKQFLKKYMYYVDYIPIRLTAYCFSIVSNYDQVIDKINNLELSNNLYSSNIEYINQTGESVFDVSQKESDQINQIQNILSRTLIAWIGLILLLSLSGVFI